MFIFLVSCRGRNLLWKPIDPSCHEHSSGIILMAYPWHCQRSVGMGFQEHSLCSQRWSKRILQHTYFCEVWMALLALQLLGAYSFDFRECIVLMLQMPSAVTICNPEWGSLSPSRWQETRLACPPHSFFMSSGGELTVQGCPWVEPTHTSVTKRCSLQKGVSVAWHI